MGLAPQRYIVSSRAGLLHLSQPYRKRLDEAAQQALVSLYVIGEILKRPLDVQHGGFRPLDVRFRSIRCVRRRFITDRVDLDDARERTEIEGLEDVIVHACPDQLGWLPRQV